MRAKTKESKSVLAFQTDGEAARSGRRDRVAVALDRSHARQLLPSLAGRMCREIYDRDWVPQLPFTLWEAVSGVPRAANEFPAEEIVLFRMLATVADGWVRYDANEGPVFVAGRGWQRAYAAWKKSGRARKTLTAIPSGKWSSHAA